MKKCKHCDDTLFTDRYEICMTCYEKQYAKIPMKKSIEEYQKEIDILQATVDGDGYNMKRLSEENEKYKGILDETLRELPVGYVPTHTYENIPNKVAELVKDNSELDTDLEKLEALQGEVEMTYKYYAGFGAKKYLTPVEMLNHILRTVPNHKPTNEEHDLEDCAHYITALQEIAKSNRKAKTCRLIALKALGELDDGEYQPELLIEENLKLRMQVEDLESKLIDIALDKVFRKEDHPITYCQDCGEYRDYHHEEHCKGVKSTKEDDSIIQDKVKSPTYAGEIWCSFCNQFHWSGYICSRNPYFKGANWSCNTIKDIVDNADKHSKIYP